MKKALIIVDVQKDFCKGGALAVPEGDAVVSVINDLQKQPYDIIVGTLDWHPADHSSFKSNSPDGIWPDHCIQNTPGSQIHDQLDTSKVTRFFTKGSNKEVDSYSGFFDNDHKSSTGMGEFLKSQGVTDVDVVGLALDYCVKATAEDAHKLGLNTSVILNATRAVNINPNDGEKSVQSLIEQGIKVK